MIEFTGELIKIKYINQQNRSTESSVIFSISSKHFDYDDDHAVAFERFSSLAVIQMPSLFGSPSIMSLKRMMHKVAIYLKIFQVILKYHGLNFAG